MAVPKRKMSRSSTRSRQVRQHAASCRARTRCAPTAARPSSRTRCAATAVGTEGGRYSTSTDRADRAASARPGDRGRGVTPMIALDAMGGDRAPAEIVAGGLRAAAELDVDVLLVGVPDAIAAHLPGGVAPDGVEVLAASEVIAMDDEPATAVRTKKDSSLVRCARAVREGGADAMVGAGNTGATMAAALLGMGRIRGVHRPAIAVPLPVFATAPAATAPQLLIDGGATVDPQPEWLVRVGACSGASTRGVRLGVDEPTVALLSNGEEPGKGDALRKAACAVAVGGEGLGRQRGGPRSPAAVGRRDRHRRFHRQRRVEDGRGRARRARGPRVRRARRARVRRRSPTRSSCACSKRPRRCSPTAPAARCCSASNGVCIISHGASGATAIVNAVACRPRLRDRRRGRPPHRGGARAGGSGVGRCRPRRTATAAPSTAPRSSGSCASSSSEILEVDDDAVTHRRAAARRPRRRRLRADRAGGSGRGRARRAHGRPRDRRRGSRRVATRCATRSSASSPASTWARRHRRDRRARPSSSTPTRPTERLDALEAALGVRFTDRVAPAGARSRTARGARSTSSRRRTSGSSSSATRCSASS